MTSTTFRETEQTHTGVRRRRRTSGAGLVAAGAAVAMIAVASFAIATPAAAAPAVLSVLTYVQGSRGPDGLDKSVFLECPANQVIVGGSEILSTNPGVFARMTGMVAGITGDHGFLTSFAEEDETGSTGNWTLFATAVCAQRPPGYEIVPAETTFTSTSPQTLTATCPAGKQLLAGFGVAQTGNHNVILDDIQPAMNMSGVTVKGFEDENGFSGTWNLFASAACATPVAGQSLFFQPSTSDSNPKPFITKACPTGKRAISFGATIDSGNGQVDEQAEFVDNNSAGFLAFEDRNGFSGNWSQTVYVTCVT
jgi:hypothetical protein